ncbi:MAG: AmmeMemoRadiSam system protein B [Gemmataceae bacterium]
MIPADGRHAPEPSTTGFVIESAAMNKHRPCLRPFLRKAQDPRDPDHFYLVDSLGLSHPARLTIPETLCLDFLDGHNTPRDIHQASSRLNGFALPSLEHVVRLVDRLDAGLLLDGPRFRRILDDPIRPPRCIGCYDADPAILREQLTDLFQRGAGLPRPRTPGSPRLRAVLVPHMDYARGGLAYTWGFKELAEKTDASLFVVIGTSHYSRHRLSLTRKSFQTPLGVVPTDQAFVDRVVAQYGPGLFDDEHPAHFPEHSVELEVVFLQYLFEERRPIRIVPLVVGSFNDCVLTGAQPGEKPDVGRMIDALKTAEAQTPEPICYVISGDLAHIGPKFNGGGEILTVGLMEQSERQDRLLMRHAAQGDMRRYFDVIAREGDRRNICGLPPTYLTVEAADARRGELLAYDRFVDPSGKESVSFASMAFYSR